MAQKCIFILVYWTHTKNNTGMTQNNQEPLEVTRNNQEQLGTTRNNQKRVGAIRNNQEQ